MLVNAELRAQYAQQIVGPTLALGAQALRDWAERHARRLANPRLTVRVMTGPVLGLLLEYSLDEPVLEAHWADLPGFLDDLFLYGLGSKPL